jgi:hypothetical protein
VRAIIAFAALAMIAPILEGYVGKPELIIDPAQEWQCENRASIFFPAVPARNNRSFDWFLIGEKENRETSPAENPPPQNAIVRN